ncbi:hypothetical protein NUW54_g14198 [Trametes sanguinea]|uniref:Uncharacterized protein n=1 Tax=Trametes sanguinea TaxID=158606 RepID=A0ACC1MEI3_9APHY|nr:hypothetical protein NUW54_g14198 [Trametes sanguinea]
MHNAYDLGPFEMREPDTKGKRKSHRNTYILDGDLSPTANMPVEASLPSPLSKFPPVPAFIHGDLASSKAGKLLKKMSSQQNLGQRNSAASWASSASHDDASTHSHSSGKHARKQRSFHHPRVPLPPLPGLRGGSSAHPSASAETLPAPTSPIVEPRRSSVTSPRKRLFSGSSARRSTSSHGPTSPSTEDDGRSILSLDTESRPVTRNACILAGVAVG